MNKKYSDTLHSLQHGEIHLQGEFLWGSNYTFLVVVRNKEKKIPAVYKPTHGVRPLWDFHEESLAYREVAAFLVSDAIGWDLVPPTVYRKDAPLGPGSLQFFIEHDPDFHYYNLPEEYIERLHTTVLFDTLINNADRKASHVIFDENDHLWLIDHGICFHEEYKLRTVVWDFAGMLLFEPYISDIKLLLKNLSMNSPSSKLFNNMLSYLSQNEIQALIHRANAILRQGQFPLPDPDRRNFP